ncbi:VWA domain-containing protein [Bengtsoniella intestinalis]|uniref:vWA domain-containing protein n=1 Tax=Bengtsoniella intestinalis TaxID=3073143 RepID=UPI00391F7041
MTALFQILDTIDEAVQTTDMRIRLDCVNRIIVHHWAYIRSYLDTLPDESDGATTGTVVVVGGSAIGSGNSSGVAGGSAAPKNPSPTAQKRGATSEAAKEADEEPEEPKEPEESTLDTEQEEIPPISPDPDETDESEGAAHGSERSDSVQKASSEETGRMPLEQTSDLDIPTGGVCEHDDGYTGSGYTDAASDIDRILDNMACEELENQRTRSMNELANNISYGNIHDGVDMRVHRISAVDSDLVEQYNAIAKPLLHISKQLQRSVLQQLQDRQRGGKQTGLYLGRRLDTHALPRRDGRIFCKSSLPNETPELSVGLLVDESGSMCSRDRITYARAASIILYDFCKSLNIPILIYGHSTGSGVDLYSYAEFESYKGDDCYRLMDMSSRGCNRDGAALRYVAERLFARPEEVKILVLISDGQPSDGGYYGTAAEEDLRGIKHEYKRKGVQLIAAAIGDDKESLERIYGDSFMDISDLNRLPVLLSSRIKQFIRL